MPDQSLPSTETGDIVPEGAFIGGFAVGRPGGSVLANRKGRYGSVESQYAYHYASEVG